MIKTNTDNNDLQVKVPAVTLGFWIIKILATTLGETGGDAISMSMDLGYLLATFIFMVIFIVAVIAQIRANFFHPVLYWATIIASTTVGTTMADFATRSLGIGYSGGSALLLMLLVGSILTWYKVLGTVSVSSIRSPTSEFYYWLTIMFSQTLGTALGDWTADTADLGYLGAAVIFSVLLLILVVLHYYTSTSKAVLFWVAFVLTRPLGAVVGDFLDKPFSEGGLALDRYSASLTLLGTITLMIWLLPQRPADNTH